MFTFIHTYAENVFPALIKSGLWREGDGLKLMHKPASVPPYDFNTLTKKDSPLYNLLKELRCTFYIDRLQGGVGYDKTYLYSEKELSDLKELLGDKFLGFQFHEWASNFRSDMKRICELSEKEGFNLENEDDRKNFWHKIIAKEMYLFLEAFSAEHWAKKTLSENLYEFLNDCENFYSLRKKETEGLLFPTDSYFLAPKTEISNGAKLLLPEVGWQIPNMRIQIAFTRGMAKSAGIPWGIYYECWQHTEGIGFSIPFSLREGQDEWLEDLLHQGAGNNLPFEKREYGGSSLSLLSRAWRYAYFSGAAFIGEEYGVCNTFRNLKTAELSPYGNEKYAFLRFTEEFNDIGEPFVPFAVILPKNLKMLDISLGEKYLEYPLTDKYMPIEESLYRKIKSNLEEIFGYTGKYGNMGHVLKCGGLPGVFDIVYEDCEEALEKYSYLIDLTENIEFTKNHQNTVTTNEAKALIDSLLPLKVNSNLFTAYNKTASGWYVLIMNNDGIQHNVFSPDIKTEESFVSTEITLSAPNTALKKCAGNGELHHIGSKYSLNLLAGEWILLFVNE